MRLGHTAPWQPDVWYSEHVWEVSLNPSYSLDLALPRGFYLVRLFDNHPRGFALDTG